MKVDFPKWLNDQLEQRGMKPADLARKSDLDSAVVSNLMNGKRNPGIRTCKAIARALEISEDEVLQAAGLLQTDSTDDPAVKAVVTLLRDMRPDDVLDILEYVRLQKRLSSKKDIPQQRQHRRNKTRVTPA